MEGMTRNSRIFRNGPGHSGHLESRRLGIKFWTFLADQDVKGVLKAQLIHECLNFILEPLKTAAQIGIMMTDALRNHQYCFTLLASFIVDTPKSALLAGIAEKTLSVTMASYKDFGDPFCHEPHTALKTLGQLEHLASKVDPWNLKNYLKAAHNLCLSSMHKPFWRDWALSDPLQFLTSEPLHHWHKQFWDHDVKWCINAVGASELDFCFSIIQPLTGFHHFSGGISKLKQVTGSKHHNIQHYIIPLIARAVSSDFLVAICSLMDFRY